MTRPTPSDPELERLLHAAVDGELTPADEAKLESLLLESREARDTYRRWMQMEALLECGLAAGEQAEPRPTGCESRSTWRRAGSLLLALVTSAATAAAVLLGVVSWWSARLTVPDAAVLTAGAEAHFTDLRSLAPLELNLGDAVPSGPLRLESGAAQVTFGSGAVVGVNAPADLEVLSADRIFLRRGRLVPLVPPQAKGFTVVLPSGEVVDLGTEFAVTVDDQGRADVKVLDGEVAVMERRGTDAQPTHLSVGHEARLAVGEAGGQPLVTAVPLLLDGFDGVDGSDLSREIEQRQSGLFAPLGYQCLEPESPARIRGGRLQIPFDAPVGRQKAKSRVVIDREFSELQGRRWSIAFKAWLPSRKDVPQSHHLDCVIGAARDPNSMPFVWDDNARIGVLVMDDRVGIDFNGSLDPPPQPALHVFPRSADGTGPYQVLIQVDETGPGDARVDVLVNGRDLLRNFRVAMPRDTGRVIGFHTWTKRDSGAHGYGEIDDVCITIDSPAPLAAAAEPADDES